MSVALSVMETAVSSLVEAEPVIETGASISPAMWKVTVAGAEVAWPSLTVKVNESVPLKLALGA